jgi:hypothetical protein
MNIAEIELRICVYGTVLERHRATIDIAAALDSAS